ncbi:hypothetical protein BDV23DRAFT_177430 [Aspergillus alliaceus]|uniref:Uncharacterized protein n=1 Tax=Petromyces alliaceus TaxID=209559 RepID=A0A5N7BQ25_PETAA|nr:hypothetical protein BDV23DRAFT_177430 [Aspergillus alliaceus]
MAPQLSIYPVRKRGRPRVYLSTVQKQASNTAQRRRQRQAACVAERSAEFNHPPILPVDSASDIISLITPDEEPSAPASLPTVSVEITVRSPILPRSPGSPDLPHLHVSLESVGPESPSPLGRSLTDQLYHHHGCCEHCHSQQQAEHDTQHADHTGLKDYLQQIQTEGGFPDVLQIYCSIYVISPDPDPDPVHICLTTDHHADTVTEVTFNIDSIVGFASSLAVAKQGVRWNPTQMAVSDLQSSLHLDPLPVQYWDQHGQSHQVHRPVYEIPHYTFGRFHYPSSFNHSQLNSTARGIESRSQQVDPVAQQQLLFYFLPPEALPLVWASILESIQQPGRQQFQDLMILIQGKNLKTLTKAIIWDGMVQLFQQHWNHASVSAYLSDQFYLDIGKETCPAGIDPARESLYPGNPGSQTVVWQRYCLESYAE